MQWSNIINHNPLYLNIGGYEDCHPKKNYENYISVDLAGLEPHSIKHNLTQPVPLADNSVDRILSEHFLEHTTEADMKNIFNEFYRILKPGCHVRVAVPDYNHPRDKVFLSKGHDPRHTDHFTLTTYSKIKSIVSQTKFKSALFYQYWDDSNEFIYTPIDYSLGHIKRTPDNDPRCKMPSSFIKRAEIFFSDFFFKLSKGFRHTEKELLFRSGRKYRVTSIVFDLKKPLA